MQVPAKFKTSFNMENPAKASNIYVYYRLQYKIDLNLWSDFIPFVMPMIIEKHLKKNLSWLALAYILHLNAVNRDLVCQKLQRKGSIVINIKTVFQ